MSTFLVALGLTRGSGGRGVQPGTRVCQAEALFSARHVNLDWVADCFSTEKNRATIKQCREPPAWRMYQHE